MRGQQKQLWHWAHISDRQVHKTIFIILSELNKTWIEFELAKKSEAFFLGPINNLQKNCIVSNEKKREQSRDPATAFLKEESKQDLTNNQEDI